MSTIPAISLDELTTELQLGKIDQFWNVLTDRYFDGTLIPGSRRVPLDQVGREVAGGAIPWDAAIVVYCANYDCPQSAQAVEKLRAFGYTNVRAYEGGLEEWAQSGLALVRRAA